MSEDSINLNIKCSNADRAEVTSPSNCTIAQLKVIVEAKCNIPALQQRLIYKGKVLKDELTLESYDIKNDDVIHLVKGVIPPGSVPAPNSTPSAINPSFSTPPSSTNINPIQNIMNNMNGGMNVNSMQQQMMQNPAMMSEMMNSPFMESLMSNPEMLQNMLQSNPQLQALMDSNPQIRQMLNDPAIIRQSLEMMRNPQAMQEAMRSQDLQLSQIENLPGGFNALSRMYLDVQEPMMEATSRLNNQSSNRNQTPPSPQLTAPNTSALPNPWGSVPSQPQPNLINGMGGGMGGMNPTMMQQMMQNMGGGGNGNTPPVYGMNNPQQMASMMSNPMVQQMMQQMMSDPAMLDQMAASNPQLAQMLQNPQTRAMLQSPMMQQMMSNPAFIQQAMNSMQNGGIPGMGGGMPNPMGGGMGGINPAMMQQMMQNLGGSMPNASPNIDFSSLFAGNNGMGNIPNPPRPVQPVAPHVDPSVRFATQLKILNDMGFNDNPANLRALQNTGGNVNTAVERLLNGI